MLFSVTYNLLDSVEDTEEVLQETWLAWSRESCRLVEHEIDNPRAYLVRVAVNQALAQQKVLNRRRETYFGPWLPEPVVTDAGNTPDVVESAMQTESISIALLVVLETLTPLERAVFVLNEAFGYAHTEIADILDRKPDAVRVPDGVRGGGCGFAFTFRDRQAVGVSGRAGVRREPETCHQLDDKRADRHCKGGAQGVDVAVLEDLSGKQLYLLVSQFDWLTSRPHGRAGDG